MQAKSTLGFGLNNSVDIFKTSPLIDDTTNTKEEQTKVLQYRSAVEALTAIAFEINQQSSGGTTDEVLTELANDLANDGQINGDAGTQINPNTLQVL
ncbi:hypothetical protein CVPH_1367 [Abyssogena phaseoliformis symbiont OG214]|uniref:hypothetical protein n=1 Tax=Abyssogena phaseoliformis symbiont TaxID=596095 RepID=UPI001915E603|nr:hypothetical protein [Abyssogena phaseoliformis symbiont]BBB23232.1 hypothetical protein CVPH_1367 [Abyssogena phaseoliformis symbiont OG214]